MLFCVDASGSMAARKRMEQVKAAVLSLLLDAYQRRDKVGLVTFRGGRRRPGAAADLLGRGARPAGWRACPAGGRTPLAEGLLERGARPCGCERLRDPRRRPLLVVVTDGRATSGADALRRVAGRRPTCWRRRGSPPWSSTARPGRLRLGLAARLAEHLRRRVRRRSAEVSADGADRRRARRGRPARAAAA